MANVYIWDACLGGSTLYTDPNVVRTTQQWGGAPGQKVEHAQRSRVEFSGEVVRGLAPRFDIMMDRIRGGIHLVGLWDFELRAQNGWDIEIAINSSGAEFFRKDGKTSLYNGEADNAPTGPWRTVNATCNGGASVGATSLPVTGLLDSETVPKGMMLRVGDYRHRVLTEVTANASGEATLTLATPLRGAISNGANVRIPGDFFVGSLIGRPEVSGADVEGLRTFTMRFAEVYEDEIEDLSGSPSEGFVYRID